MRLYKVMFCKFYEWASKIRPKGYAALNAASCLGLIILSNLLSLWWLVTFFLGYTSQEISIESMGIFFFISLLSINIILRLILLRKGKYLMICKEFSDKNFRYWGLSKALITRVYGILSIVIFIATAILYFKS